MISKRSDKSEWREGYINNVWCKFKTFLSPDGDLFVVARRDAAIRVYMGYHMDRSFAQGVRLDEATITEELNKMLVNEWQPMVADALPIRLKCKEILRNEFRSLVIYGDVAPLITFVLLTSFVALASILSGTLSNPSNQDSNFILYFSYGSSAFSLISTMVFVAVKRIVIESDLLCHNLAKAEFVLKMVTKKVALDVNRYQSKISYIQSYINTAKTALGMAQTQSKDMRNSTLECSLNLFLATKNLRDLTRELNIPKILQFGL